MTVQAVYLDGGSALNDISENDLLAKRKEFLRDSLSTPVGQLNILVTKSSVESLKLEGIIPENSSIRVVSISGSTKGALASALLAIELIQPREPVLLIPTNSIVDDLNLREFFSKMMDDGVVAGALLVKSDNPNYSYVRIHNNRVIEFIEKRVVGDMATTGVFFFRSKALLLECAKWAFVNSQITNSQFFVAPSLNYVLTSGQEVGFSQIDQSQYKHI